MWLGQAKRSNARGPAGEAAMTSINWFVAVAVVMALCAIAIFMPFAFAAMGQ